jgi:hypothetical protein
LRKAFNQLGGERDHLAEIGMNDDRSQHLVVIGHFAILVMARHAVLAVNLLGGEVFDPVQGDQVTVFEVDIIFKDLAALRLAEDFWFCAKGAD